MYYVKCACFVIVCFVFVHIVMLFICVLSLFRFVYFIYYKILSFYTDLLSRISLFLTFYLRYLHFPVLSVQSYFLRNVTSIYSHTIRHLNSYNRRGSIQIKTNHKFKFRISSIKYSSTNFPYMPNQHRDKTKTKHNR